MLLTLTRIRLIVQLLLMLVDILHGFFDRQYDSARSNGCTRKLVKLTAIFTYFPVILIIGGDLLAVKA